MDQVIYAFWFKSRQKQSIRLTKIRLRATYRKILACFENLRSKLATTLIKIKHSVGHFVPRQIFCATLLGDLRIFLLHCQQDSDISHDVLRQENSVEFKLTILNVHCWVFLKGTDWKNMIWSKLEFSNCLHQQYS